MTDQYEIDTHRAVLATKMPENDAGAATVREYLSLLLTKLWAEEADFSGKHPFGNSGWEWDLINALDGTLAKDPDEAVVLISEAIAAWGRGDV